MLPPSEAVSHLLRASLHEDGLGVRDGLVVLDLEPEEQLVRLLLLQQVLLEARRRVRVQHLQQLLCLLGQQGLEIGCKPHANKGGQRVSQEGMHKPSCKTVSGPR